MGQPLVKHPEGDQEPAQKNGVVQESSSIIKLMRVMGNGTRLGAIRLLWDGEEHCLCEMMAALNATQSRMSRHMGALKNIGLVTDRRDAQWVRYRRAPDIPATFQRVIESVLMASSTESGQP